MWRPSSFKPINIYAMGPETDHIRIRGARVHNLKNVDLELPLRKLICFAGPSGSGKTSLAFHTLLSESRRRFVNSFPNSMKFFADRPSAVDVDEIYPVLPVFGLPQTNPVMGSRSVVSDVMRVTEVLQGLYFNYSREFCPIHLQEVQRVPFSAQLGQATLKLKDEVFHLLVSADLGAALFGTSFTPTRSWDSKKKQINPFDAEDDHWEVLRFKHSTLASLDAKYAEEMKKLEGRPMLLWGESMKKPVSYNYVSQRRCPVCDYAGRMGIRSSHFAPHSALGACKACNGHGANLVFDEEKIFDKDLSFNDSGVALLKFGPLDWWRKELAKIMKKKKWSLDEPLKKLPKEFFKVAREGEGGYEGFEDVKTYLNSKRYKPAVRVFVRKMQKEELCLSCMGSRLDHPVDNFLLKFGQQQYALKDLGQLSIADFATVMEKALPVNEKHAQKLRSDLAKKATLAKNMGLGHLQLSRKTKSLSAGEYQRLLLLKYLSFEGTDSLFILDEPSLGLGQQEQSVLIEGLREVIAQGNTVLLIDHSEFMQKASDHLVIMGPEAGQNGGNLIYAGATKAYRFAPQEKINFTPLPRTKKSGESITVTGPEVHGLAWPDFSVPLNEVVWVHGPSGSGKTSCLVNVLAQNLNKKIHHDNIVDEPGTAQSIKGGNSIADVIVIDANLNRFTSRSTVGSLTDLAPAVRKHFLKLPVCKAMGLKDGHLSRNSDLGMCPRCEGRGHLVIEMQYLEDIVLPCEDCNGKGMKPAYANISDGTMTVAEAFNRPLGDVLSRIDLTPKFRRTWEYLKILNIEYLSLERPLNSLSGGEKQRLYLLSKLLKNMTDNLLIFENLSFGLSPREILKVGTFLRDLAKLGNTIIIIDADPLFGQIANSELVIQTPKPAKAQ